MLIFYLITFLASLPILAYLLAQKTNSKGLVLGYSILIFSVCLIVFISKFAVFGSLNKQIITNKINEQIYIDSKISKEYLKEVEDNLNAEEIKIWMIQLISKSIDLNKLNSAESLIAFSERFFITKNEKVIFFDIDRSAFSSMYV